mgnify:CR=1 FL=1
MAEQGTTTAVQDAATSGKITSTEAEATSNGETTSIQSEQQTDNAGGEIGTENLPPELEETRKQLMRDYHEKTQKIASERAQLVRELEGHKNQSGMLQQLMQQEWFKKAMEAERARREGHVEDVQVTPEQFEIIKNDPNEFKKFVNGLAEKIVQGKVSPELGRTQETLKEFQTEREFDRVAAKHKDFRDLNEKGLLSEYIKQGMTYETAYKAYKFDTEFQSLDRKAHEKAQEILRETRDGAVSRGGMPQITGEHIIKVRDLEDLLNKGFEAEKKRLKWRAERA